MLKFQKIPSKLKTENMKKARKKISLSKLAEKLGLSKSSVSRALSGNPGVSAKTAKAVAEAAKKFGYKKSVPLSRAMSFARSGAAGDFETIAFVNAKPARDFYGRYSAISKYVSAAKEAARRRGYAVCDIWLHEKNFTPRNSKNSPPRAAYAAESCSGTITGTASPPNFAEPWES